MYLIILGLIAVGAGLLLVYYSMKDKKSKTPNAEIKKDADETDEKGKVIYLFDEEEESDSKEGSDEDLKDHKTEQTVGGEQKESAEQKEGAEEKDNND